MSCDLTPGLYPLIFLSKPENCDDQDLKMYKKIILETNIHILITESRVREHTNIAILIRS